MRPLENRYAPSELPKHVEGIVVLDSGLGPAIALSRKAVAFGPGLGPLVAARILARRAPEARVVFSGGSGAIAGNRTPATRAAEIYLTGMGLDPKRLTLEDKSRNTWENLVFSKRLVQPKRGETWILVTSAHQMPRAMAVAKRLGWKMIPWPTDYTTPRRGTVWYTRVADNLRMTDIAVHEWIGLVAYEITGRAA